MLKHKLLALLLTTGLVAPGLAFAEGTIKIGPLATFEGPFTVLGEDGLRGAMTAIDEVGGKVSGMDIEVVRGSSDASPDSAVLAARKLVEQDGVTVLVGPLSGDEGIAVKDYAKTQPGVTFINGPLPRRKPRCATLPRTSSASRPMARSGWRVWGTMLSPTRATSRSP